MIVIVKISCIFATDKNNKKIEIMTVKNQTLVVKSNKSARTFTIRTFIDGKLSSKYRTNKMSKLEFESNEYNTDNDWKQFLKSDDYYIV